MHGGENRVNMLYCNDQCREQDAPVQQDGTKTTEDGQDCSRSQQGLHSPREHVTAKQRAAVFLNARLQEEKATQLKVEMSQYAGGFQEQLDWGRLAKKRKAGNAG